MLKHTVIAWALVAMASACAQQPSVPAQPAAADATVARGRLLFLRCASCHEVEDRGLNKIGPTLKGVVGRPVASVRGYGYSAALRSRSFAWDEAQLDRWIENPAQLTPETTMAFIGLPAADDRKALIAYLRTLR